MSVGPRRGRRCWRTPHRRVRALTVEARGPSGPIARGATSRFKPAGNTAAACEPRGTRRSRWSEIMASVPSAGTLFSPLDRELGLLPGELTPQLQEQCTRLGQAADSFQEAADLVTSFTRVRVSESTVRRLTEGGGAALLAAETAAASKAEPPWGTVEAAPEQLFLSADGAMVPLLHGEWREVKTLVVGVPEPATKRPKERVAQEVTCQALSYFSRLTDCHAFSALATVEMKRRRVSEARRVAGGSDGADWIQGVFDDH